MAETFAAKRTDIGPGTTKRIDVDNGVLLCNVAGELFAIEDACSHDGGELDQAELEDCRIMCPRHGAYFDVRTGAALTLPAIVPVRTYPVRVDGEDVYIEV